jgi:hypothetical protein
MPSETSAILAACLTRSLSLGLTSPRGGEFIEVFEFIAANCTSGNERASRNPEQLLLRLQKNVVTAKITLCSYAIVALSGSAAYRELVGRGSILFQVCL